MVAALFAAVSIAQAPKTDEEKVVYALGAAIGKGVAQFRLTKAEMEMLKQGLTDAATGSKLQANPQEYEPKIRDLQRSRAEAAEKAVLDQAAKQKGAQATASGLVYQELKAGRGPQPKATDTVKVHYKGTLPDGTEFDSSYGRGQPTEFPLNGVIPCWTEGVQKIKTGGKAKLTCPAKIAYGERSPSPKIPPNSTLVFEIELLEVKPVSPPAGAK